MAENRRNNVTRGMGTSNRIKTISYLMPQTVIQSWYNWFIELQNITKTDIQLFWHQLVYVFLFFSILFPLRKQTTKIYIYTHIYIQIPMYIHTYVYLKDYNSICNRKNLTMRIIKWKFQINIVLVISIKY